MFGCLWKKRGEKRTYWDIQFEIADSIPEEGKVETRIMNKAYLDFRNLKRHFDPLSEYGVVTEIDGLYYLTEKGKEYKTVLKKLKEKVEETKSYFK